MGRLFRGKTKDKWVKGRLFSEDVIVPLNQEYFLNGDNPSFFEIDEDLEKLKLYIVDKKTVGEYTSLNDKNNVEIFTGDIVRYQQDNDDCPFPNKDVQPRIGRVFFSSFRASFAIATGKNGSSMTNQDLYKYIRNGNRVEVIGNIYDNPELLKNVS